jgi:D-alanine-D-alanine ligase
MFRREPELLYGEGIGISRAPLVMLEFALRSLRNRRQLHKSPIGILYYMDEGRDCRYSAEIIRKAASRARRVLVLRPGTRDDKVIIQRRGEAKYRLVVEGKIKRLGQHPNIPEVLPWICDKLRDITKLSSPKDKLSVSAVNIATDAFPMLLPHRISADLMISYLDKKTAEEAEEKIKEMMVRKGFKCELEKISDRPPMKERRHNLGLAKELSAIADKWDIPFGSDSSVWPSAGGLVPAKVPVVCGIGPTSRDLYTPQEAVNRTSLIQRTLLIAQFLAHEIGS